MFKEIIFFPRIICFNESFVPLGKQVKKPIVMIWQEAIAGRSQSDLISTFNKFLLLHRDINKITIWVNNCKAQNKNCSLSAVLLYSLILKILKLTA